MDPQTEEKIEHFKHDAKRIGIGAAILIALILLMLTNIPYQWLTYRTVENVRISDKNISTESDKKKGTVESTYLIYTDHGTYRNDDALWHLKWNSSDVYGMLEKDKHYNLKVYGFRIPILTMYPNIVSVKEVPETAVAP